MSSTARRSARSSGLGFLCLVLGWQTGLLAALFHLVFYVGLNSVINAWGHTVGHAPAAELRDERPRPRAAHRR